MHSPSPSPPGGMKTHEALTEGAKEPTPQDIMRKLNQWPDNVPKPTFMRRDFAHNPLSSNHSASASQPPAQPTPKPLFSIGSHFPPPMPNGQHDILRGMRNRQRAFSVRPNSSTPMTNFNRSHHQAGLWPKPGATPTPNALATPTPLYGDHNYTNDPPFANTANGNTATGTGRPKSILKNKNSRHSINYTPNFSARPNFTHPRPSPAPANSATRPSYFSLNRNGVVPQLTPVRPSEPHPPRPSTDRTKRLSNRASFRIPPHQRLARPVSLPVSGIVTKSCPLVDLREHVKSLAEPGKRTHVNPKYPALDPPRSSTPPPYEDSVLKTLKSMADFDRQEREREINRRKRSGIPIVPPNASIKRRRSMGKFLPPPLSFEPYKPKPRATNAVICYREYLAKKEKEGALSTANGKKDDTRTNGDDNKPQPDKENNSGRKDKFTLGVGNLVKKSHKAKSTKKALQNAVQRDMVAGIFPYQLSPEALKRIADRRAKKQAEMEAKWAAPKKLFTLPGEKEPAPTKKRPSTVRGSARTEHHSLTASATESEHGPNVNDDEIHPVPQRRIPGKENNLGAPSSKGESIDTPDREPLSTDQSHGSHADAIKPTFDDETQKETAQTQGDDKKLSLAEIKLREADAKLAEAKALEEKVAKMKAELEAAQASAERLRKESEQRKETEPTPSSASTPATNLIDASSVLGPSKLKNDNNALEKKEKADDGPVRADDKGGFPVPTDANQPPSAPVFPSNPFTAKLVSGNPSAAPAATSNPFETPAPSSNIFQAPTPSSSNPFHPPPATSATQSSQAPSAPSNPLQAKASPWTTATPVFGGVSTTEPTSLAQTKEPDADTTDSNTQAEPELIQRKDQNVMFGAKLGDSSTKAPQDSAAKPEMIENKEAAPVDDDQTAKDSAEFVKTFDPADQQNNSSTVEQPEQKSDADAEKEDKESVEPSPAETTKSFPAPADGNIQPSVSAAPSKPFSATIDVNNPFQLKTFPQADKAPIFNAAPTTNLPSHHNSDMGVKDSGDPVSTEEKPSGVSAVGKRSASANETENANGADEKSTEDNAPAKRSASAFPFGSSFGSAAPIFGGTPTQQGENLSTDANDKDPMTSPTKDDKNDATSSAVTNPFALGSGTTFGATASGPIFGGAAPVAKSDGGPFADSKFSANSGPANFSSFVFGANKQGSAPPAQAQSNPGFGFGENTTSSTGFQFGSSIPSAPGGLGSQNPTVFGGSAATTTPAPTTFGVNAPTSAAAPPGGTLNDGNSANGNAGFGASGTGSNLFSGSFNVANPFGSGGGSGFGAAPTPSAPTFGNNAGTNTFGTPAASTGNDNTNMQQTAFGGGPFAQAQNPSATPTPAPPPPGANPFSFNQAPAQVPGGGNAAFSIGSTAAAPPRRRVRVRRTLNQR